MLLTGSRVVMECLREQGVDTVFGYPGGTIIDLYDALIDYPEIKHYLSSHEQGAGHAADGYARSTGKVGVCFATSGPGCANLTTAIATAYMDSSPVVFITCNVSEKLLGKDTFQEVDITGITMPITKWNYMVHHASSLPDVLREAFAIARSGRPGPVLIDIAKNAAVELVDYEHLPRELHHTQGRLKRLLERRTAQDDLKPPEPVMDDIDKLVEMIKASEKPLVICGGGVVRGRADKEFGTFVDKIDSPVAVTLMGAGGISGTNPLTTGMVGMHGSQASNQAVAGCDLLIAVGCRFSDRVALNPETFAAQAKIVQIDIDRAEINKNVITDHHVIGDAAQVLGLLNERLEQMDHTSWKDFVFSHPTETEYDEAGETLTPKQITEVIARICPANSIVATDVGQHQMWAAQHLHYDYPGQLLTSGGFGAMGFGLGAAVGAKVGNPDKVVLHITGDGSFRMNCNELAMVQAYDVPVITIVFNNGVLGMVRQWQSLVCKGRYSQTTLDRGPDFVKLAEAYGLRGARATNVEEFEVALTEALEYGHGFVIDCAIDKDEKVRPMVGGGQDITSFLLA